MTDTLSLAKDLVKVERQIAKVEAILQQLTVKRIELLSALGAPVVVTETMMDASQRIGIFAATT